MTRRGIVRRIAKVDRRPAHEQFLDTQECAKVGTAAQLTLQHESDAATTQNGDDGDKVKSNAEKIEFVRAWPSDIVSEELHKITVGIEVCGWPPVSLDVSRAQKAIPEHENVTNQTHRNPGSLGQHYQGEDPRMRHRERR
jgi:hypothetical protein